MKHYESYDEAHRLCRVLSHHKNLFTVEPEIIIYPDAWYNKFFEILLRDKNDSTRSVVLNVDELSRIVGKYMSKGWVLSEMVSDSEGNGCTPLRLKFKEV